MCEANRNTAEGHYNISLYDITTLLVHCEYLLTGAGSILSDETFCQESHQKSWNMSTWARKRESVLELQHMPATQIIIALSETFIWHCHRDSIRDVYMFLCWRKDYVLYNVSLIIDIVSVRACLLLLNRLAVKLCCLVVHKKGLQHSQNKQNMDDYLSYNG